MFLHSPLDPDNGEIRLVRFITSDDIETADPESGIALELQHKSRANSIHYTAISYTWGNVEDMMEISINGRSLSICRNLYHCLLQLRAQGLDSWLWADQICISQSDMEEKRQQVAQMDRVFGDADLVYAWLGLSSPGTEQAMKWIAKTGSQAPTISPDKIWRRDLPHNEIYDYLEARSPEEPDDKEMSGASDIAQFLYHILNDDQVWRHGIVKGIHDILRRDYWHRVWVIQELALAQNIVIMCGGESVSFDDFDRTFCAIQYSTQHGLFHLHEKYSRSNRIIDGTAYRIKSLNIRRKKNLQEPIHIEDILFESGAPPNRPHYSASDPRDLAFALIGVLADESRQMLTVDYKQTVENVFTMLTRAIMNKPEGRFRLDWCTPREEETAMPTWVPDWRQVGRYGFGVYPIDYQSFHGRFDATAGTPSVHLTHSGIPEAESFLHFHGYSVDVITDVLQPPKWEQNSEWDVPYLRQTEPWLDSIYKFADLGSESGPGEDYIWRTLLRNYDLLPYGFDQNTLEEDVLYLIRQLFRRTKLQSDSLSENQVYFIQNGTSHPRFMARIATLEKQVEHVEQDWCSTVGSVNRHRTLFKTQKSMFGLGHQSVRAGDLVAILHGMATPIILRKRGVGSGFLFAGDAYVDGIMYGEYLRTTPVLSEVHIH